MRTLDGTNDFDKRSMSSNGQSAWSPFRIPLFRNLWIATLASNTGTWMHDVGAGWLMTSLSPSSVMVALVQTATALPIFLLAMPAGALSDIVDRRHYLIAVQVWMALVAAALGIMTLTGVTTAWTLVLMTFAMGAGAAMLLPAWAAMTPELVPRDQLHSAIALNSLGINVARAIGPAAAGVIVYHAGTGAVFVLNALSYLGVLIVLTRWRREASVSTLPSERFLAAMRSGMRFALHAPELQAAIMRGFSFFLFASATWALLPLVAKHLVNGGPQAFGLLVASLGAGAVVGAIVLPKLREKVSRDLLVASATLLYAATMASLGSLSRLAPLCLAMAINGIAWITVLSSLQVAAQMALPNWVRARGLALFMTAFMGAMAGGSLIWGAIADFTSISRSLMIAAAGLAVAAAVSWRWHIGGFDNADLTPSMHWPVPDVHAGVTHDRGPVFVTIEYDVRPEEKMRFLKTVRQLGRNRRRDGAFAWGVYENTARQNHFIESFCVESWLEHLRQHERVTNEDRVLQEKISELLASGSAPKIDHYVAPAKADSKPKLSAKGHG